MKKGWKVFWIVCAVLAAVGILLTVAGAVLGGFGMLRTREDEGVIRSLLDRMGIRHETTVTNDVVIEDLDDLTDKDHVPGEVNGDTVTAYEGVGELDIELAGMGIRVAPYDGESIIVDTSGCRADIQDKINVWQDGRELKVEMEDRGSLSTQDTGVMYISVPQGTYFSKVSADARAGLIEIEGVEAGKLSVSADAGEVVIRSFSAEKVEADCGVGQIILEGEVTHEAEMNCDMGAIQCRLPGEREAYDYEIDCDLGSVTVDGESYSSFHNKIKEDNGNGCKIEADCNLGSIEILFD